MRIQYCQIEGGNFGDDLNRLLWPSLFPDLAHRAKDTVFYGIGTILDGHHAKQLKKVVLGAGIGEAHAAKADANWDFRWVRGPDSAREFGLPAELALGDSALLWSELQQPYRPNSPQGPRGQKGPTGLIPHYATWDSYDWERVAAKAGMVAINPRLPPGEVVARLRDCERVMAESLHGAICADAMGIPWAACILAHRFNDFKWRDWLATIDRPRDRLFPAFVTDRPLVRAIHPAKAAANRLARSVNYLKDTRHPALRPVATATAQDEACVAEALYQFSRDDAHFACSSPRHVTHQRERMVDACASFANDYGLRLAL